MSRRLLVIGVEFAQCQPLIGSEFEVKINHEHPSKRQDKLSLVVVPHCQFSSPLLSLPPPLFNIIEELNTACAKVPGRC